MNVPRLSAVVILWRQQPQLQTFWMRRAAQMAFQGGFHAFPGGQLHDGEDVRAGAVRELEEETGVRVDPAGLIEVGRWVTPPFLPRRFHTQFFLARSPSDQNPRVANVEHDFGEWIEPQAAIRKWRDGEILMAPPVKYALERLAEGLDNMEERMKAVPEAHGAAATEVELRAGIALVPLKAPTLPPATHTNCYIIGQDELIVIDPASPDAEEQTKLDGILERRRAPVREIWLTHLHRDHVSGANHLRERFHVPIAAHPITARDLRDFVKVDREFGPGETVDLSGDPGWTLRVLHTPGHARGHVCIFEERHRSLITADLMAGFGTILIDPPEGHMATYLDSLERMKRLGATALFPSHGPVMTNPKERIQEYIDHRLAREKQILDAWNAGLRDTASIVARVYTDVPATMHRIAERSAAAHLEKLREENRI